MQEGDQNSGDSAHIRNRDEVIAARYLEQANFVALHEPNGFSTFPDFGICDGTIGVEVRCVPRTLDGPSLEPLETASASLWMRTERLLAGLDRSDLPTSYCVLLQFERPIPAWREVAKAIKLHLARPVDELRCSHLQIAENISISVLRLDHKDNKAFLFGGNFDNEAGGYVVASMIEGIQKSIADKTLDELKNRPHGYTRLWLILVNRMDQHLGSDEVADITEEVKATAPWERIILLSPDASLLTEWNVEQ